MIRNSMVKYVCAAIGLLVSVPVVVGQQQGVLPQQNAFLTPSMDPDTGQSKALTAAISSGTVKADAGSGAHLPLFNYTVTSSRDGNTYNGTIVGADPTANGNQATAVPSQIVPVIVVTHSVFAGFDAHGNIVTAPGTTTFDPTVADDSCLSAPNDVPLTLVQNSPIFNGFDFNFGGTDVGTTQTTDAFQRANFFSLLGHGNSSFANSVKYHVILSPVNTVAAIVVDIPAANGVAYPSALFVGGCPTGKVGIVDLRVYEPALFNAITTSLGSQGVNPATFPMFTEHNVVECEAFAPGVNCGTLAPGTECCILGFHSHNGQQTLGTADFDTSGIFGSSVADVSGMSHEVGEWMNNPLNGNPTPRWGHVGQVSGCQGNLEVGDPLSGTLAPPIFNPNNGFTYHMQELAFFSWFYGAPSVGINGWFSNNDTFTHDAGPVCVP